MMRRPPLPSGGLSDGSSIASRRRDAASCALDVNAESFGPADVSDAQGDASGFHAHKCASLPKIGDQRAERRCSSRRLISFKATIRSCACCGASVRPDRSVQDPLDLPQTKSSSASRLALPVSCPVGFHPASLARWLWAAIQWSLPPAALMTSLMTS